VKKREGQTPGGKRPKTAEQEEAMYLGKDGKTEKEKQRKPMMPGAMAAAIHRLKTEVEICASKGWARCDKEEVRKEVRKIERMIQ
jgi:hypothetical protein